MSNQLRKTLLAWNAFALAGFILGGAYIAWDGWLDVRMKITALDRTGVINEGKLKESWPELAWDLRNTLGPWVAERPLEAGKSAAIAGAGVAAANLLILLLWRRRKPVAVAPEKSAPVVTSPDLPPSKKAENGAEPKTSRTCLP